MWPRTGRVPTQRGRDHSALDASHAVEKPDGCPSADAQVPCGHFDPRMRIRFSFWAIELTICQDFTSDPALLTAAMQKYRSQSSAAGRMAGTDVQLQARRLKDQSSATSTGPGGAEEMPPARDR